MDISWALRFSIVGTKPVVEPVVALPVRNCRSACSAGWGGASQPAVGRPPVGRSRCDTPAVGVRLRRLGCPEVDAPGARGCHAPGSSPGDQPRCDRRAAARKPTRCCSTRCGSPKTTRCGSPTVQQPENQTRCGSPPGSPELTPVRHAGPVRHGAPGN